MVNSREENINASPEISVISQNSSEIRKNSIKKILKSHVTLVKNLAHVPKSVPKKNSGFFMQWSVSN